MITGLKYTNSAGKIFDFDQQGVHPRFETVFDWEVDTLQLNGELAAYSREPRDLEVALTIVGRIDKSQVMNTLYSALAYDLANQTFGYLSVGDWSIPCALIKSSKTLWWREKQPTDYSLTFRSFYPFWTKTVTYQFFKVSEIGSALDYEHDFAFDYGGSGQSSIVTVDSVFESDFFLRIYGPATNPYVIIAGNRYEVDVSVPEGSLLEVDSAAGTVTLISDTGVRSNVFGSTPDAYSGSGEWIFQPIPPGTSSLAWDGTFGFDLLIYERSDERKWN